MVSSFEKFSGIYCSGLYILNPKIVTALSLLFEDIYIPNNLEIAMDFAKNYHFTNLPDKINKMASDLCLSPHDNNNNENPLNILTAGQQVVLKQYLTITAQFMIHYHNLVGPVIKTDMLENGEIFDVELIRQGDIGEKNLYSVKLNPLQVTVEEDGDSFKTLLAKGGVPIICERTPNNFLTKRNLNDINSMALACLLAMKSIELVLPATKPADGDTILEARHKLRDFLPPFWASMLKLSVELKNRIVKDTPTEQMLFESQEIVNTTVLPALIELKQKLLKERKDWFSKIIYPITSGLKLLIGNPQLTPDGLMRAALYSSVDVIGGIYSQARAVDILKRENGLAFLLELDKIIEK